MIMTNEQLAKSKRVVYSSLLTFLLVALFVASDRLALGETIPLLYLNIFLLLNLIEGCTLITLFMYILQSEKVSSEAEIFTVNKQLLTLANTDPLTSLLNRRNMMASIEAEKEKMDRGGLPFSLIMIDVDNFKQINDEYGHDCGDFVLVMMAEKIRFGVRKNDLICRWGGDEFLILLAETDLPSCQLVAEKVRLRVINSPFIYHEIDIPVTITLGMSLCDKNGSVGASIRKADLALYKGKQEGKNRSISMN
jgi:diguanylate cyclase (GGDEF)-like protein